MTVERGLAIAICALISYLFCLLGYYHREHYESAIVAMQEENCSADHQYDLDTHRAYRFYFVASFACYTVALLLASTFTF